VLEAAFAETQASGKDPLEGLIALSLKRTLQKRGYTVKAYRVDLEKLADCFRRGGLPVVAVEAPLSSMPREEQYILQQRRCTKAERLWPNTR